MYYTIEKSFVPITEDNKTPWMRKNPTESIQTFPQYKSGVSGTLIEEILIYEMWEEQKDCALAEKEKQFQRMLVNNMESVFKTFFRNITTIRIENNPQVHIDDKKFKNVESNLTELEKKKIITTRIPA